MTKNYNIFFLKGKLREKYQKSSTVKLLQIWSDLSAESMEWDSELLVGKKNKVRKEAIDSILHEHGTWLPGSDLHKLQILDSNECKLCQERNLVMNKDHLYQCSLLEADERRFKNVNKLYWEVRRLMNQLPNVAVRNQPTQF